jgi:hypothetical protein
MRARTVYVNSPHIFQEYLAFRVSDLRRATHTLKFTAVQKATVKFSATSQGIQETDVNSTGKAIGFDMLYFTATSATSGAANATVDATGGFLYGTFNINLETGAVTNGKVTGGTGAFKGATGTITAKALNRRAPDTPSRSPIAASQARQPDQSGTVPVAGRPAWPGQDQHPGRGRLGRRGVGHNWPCAAEIP